MDAIAGVISRFCGTLSLIMGAEKGGGSASRDPVSPSSKEEAAARHAAIDNLADMQKTVYLKIQICDPSRG
jgi:hypothetical protein